MALWCAFPKIDHSPTLSVAHRVRRACHLPPFLLRQSSFRGFTKEFAAIDEGASTVRGFMRCMITPAMLWGVS